VDIKVGPEKRLFKLHKQLLCDASPYFEAALNGQFKESNDQTIEMQDEAVSMFERFQLWIYSGNIRGIRETLKDISWEILVKLYIFGEARQMPLLQNHAVQSLIFKSHNENLIPCACLSLVYDNTLENSTLRRLFIDWYVHRAILSDTHCFTPGFRKFFPKDFLFDLACGLYALRASGEAVTRDFRMISSRYFLPILT